MKELLSNEDIATIFSTYQLGIAALRSSSIKKNRVDDVKMSEDLQLKLLNILLDNAKWRQL